MKHVLLAFLMLCGAVSTLAQEYSYTHYDISDGLAGSTVYCITQDRDGFIWVGTATGVSRFDGTHFRNYTAVDGLPDVEVLEMFGDSRGRVWMAPFSKSICYSYKGRIYNQQNDSMLRRMNFSSNIDRFAEDSAGNILVQGKTWLYFVDPKGIITRYDSIDGHPIRDCASVTGRRDGFLVQVGNMIYSLSGGRFASFCPISIESSWPVYTALNGTGFIWRSDSLHTTVRSFASGRTFTFHFEKENYRHISYGVLKDDSLFYVNETTGSTQINIHTGRTQTFLPGTQVSKIFRDITGNLWFTTLDQGLYRLNSDEFRTIGLKQGKTEPTSVTAIGRIDDRLIVGTTDHYRFVFQPPDMTKFRTVVDETRAYRDVFYVGKLNNGNYYSASKIGLLEDNRELHHIRSSKGLGLKSVFNVGKDSLLVAANWGAGWVDLRSLTLLDTIWRERSTTVFYRQDTSYIGTLNGLYAVPGGRPAVFLGTKVPFLKKRISGICASADGTLWVAAYDGGVIGYRNGAVTAQLSKQRGLTSDICRTLFVHGNDLWIGTDKGLNKVHLDRPDLPVDRYTSKDGLGSDMINCIFAEGQVVYVGTPAGLSYFDETRVNTSEGCPLYLLSIQNSGRERIDDTASLLLPYTDKHLRVEFAGISYRSVGGITYRYRLLGLDTSWRTTKESFLEYLTLPSGKYTLQLQAVNKFGIASGMVPLHFEVATPWWQTWWFDALVFLSAVSFTWLFVTFRIRQVRNREKEKEKLNQRMLELEHTALQSQMNPHFIFNCLNSIQQYVFDQDIFAANKYITGFAKLIRATLQNSSREFIFLSEEVSYLSGYLSLEKLRFKEKMDYTIDVDPALQAGAYLVPPMLIQPYVENSMRHGMRHKTKGKGLIHIRFRHEGDRLSAMIEDNGIGRKKAATFKTREHIEYQSKGMSLTADRVRMINARYKQPIRVEVFDLEDEAGEASGTRVVITLPFFHLISENETI